VASPTFLMCPPFSRSVSTNRKYMILNTATNTMPIMVLITLCPQSRERKGRESKETHQLSAASILNPHPLVLTCVPQSHCCSEQPPSSRGNRASTVVHAPPRVGAWATYVAHQGAEVGGRVALHRLPHARDGGPALCGLLRELGTQHLGLLEVCGQCAAQWGRVGWVWGRAAGSTVGSGGGGGQVQAVLGEVWTVIGSVDSEGCQPTHPPCPSGGLGWLAVASSSQDTPSSTRTRRCRR
jgi:hypothetical protein